MSEEKPTYLDKPETILFQAQVFKIQTLVDGGMRLTLDVNLPAIDSQSILKLIGASQPGIILEVAAVAINTEKQTNDRPRPTKPKY